MSKNGVSKSIVHVIKQDNFQLYTGYSDRVTRKNWQMTKKFHYKSIEFHTSESAYGIAA